MRKVKVVIIVLILTVVFYVLLLFPIWGTKLNGILFPPVR